MAIGVTRLTGDDRRRQLLDVARRLFSSNGYHRTTTAALARGSGITEPILYRHFSSKKALFLAVIEDVEQEEDWKWRRRRRDLPDPMDRLKELFRELAKPRYHSSYRMIWHALLESRDAEVNRLATRALNKHRRFLEDLLTELRDAGRIQPTVDVHSSALKLISIEQGLVLTAAVLSNGMSLEETVRCIWNSLFSGTLRTAAAAPVLNEDSGTYDTPGNAQPPSGDPLDPDQP